MNVLSLGFSPRLWPWRSNSPLENLQGIASGGGSVMNDAALLLFPGWPKPKQMVFRPDDLFSCYVWVRAWTGGVNP